MITAVSNSILATVASVKGVLMAAVLILIANVTFIQGLVTAAVSAIISGTFLLVSVHMMARRTEDNKKKLEIVGTRVGELPQAVADKVNEYE